MGKEVVFYKLVPSEHTCKLTIKEFGQFGINGSLKEWDTAIVLLWDTDVPLENCLCLYK